MPSLLAPIASMLLRMVVAALSAKMIKLAVIQALEFGVEKYQEKAKKSPEQGDDKIADALRKGLDALEAEWKDL